jgi:hypothetical protein
MHLLAFGWDPEIRGIVAVLVGVVVLMGSVYLILGTNLGARLGFLVAFACLFGWITLMGAVWWTYGIGLKGKDPSWAGKEVVVGDLSQAAHTVAQVPNLTDATFTEKVNGWKRLTDDDPQHGQASAAADDVLVNRAKIFSSTSDYVTTAVFDYGGQRKPDIRWGPSGNWNFDYFAFWHQPHYAIVEVYPVIPQQTEPGKAPPKPIADTSKDPVYILLQRNLGNRRRPAALITIGSAIIFGLAITALRSRERRVNRHLAEPLPPAAPPVPAEV